MIRGGAALLAAPLLLWPGPLARAEEPDSAPERERPVAGGTLAWISTGELDLIGDMRAELPHPVGRGRSFFFSLEARTSVEHASALDTFLVRDLDYALDLGLRSRRAGTGGRPLSLFVGQSGTEQADANGQPWVRYVGAGIESRGFRSLGRGLQWKVQAGPVLDKREVQADGIVRADVQLNPRARDSFLASHLGFDLEVSGLVDGGSFRADWRGGPNLQFGVAGGRRFSFFAHYLESDNPLGIGSSGVLLGIDYSEGDDGRPVTISPPDIDGIVGAGGGDGRVAGRFKLRFLSPLFARDARGVVVVDAHLLTAEDTGELFYVYYLGIEREIGRRLAGAYLYHRSNHALAEPNDTITSINVLELGLETDAWDRPGRRRPSSSWGLLDYRARPGLLVNSTFGERRRWHFRGGLRWTLPGAVLHGLPFLLIEVEEGDVGRRLYAAGLAPWPRVEFRLQYMNDEQYLGIDRTAVLLTSLVGF